jgi:hypothetical protein
MTLHSRLTKQAIISAAIDGFAPLVSELKVLNGAMDVNAGSYHVGISPRMTGDSMSS